MSNYTMLVKALKPVVKQIGKSVIKTVAKETVKKAAIIGGSVGGVALAGGTTFGIYKAVQKKKAAALHPVDSDEDEITTESNEVQIVENVASDQKPAQETVAPAEVITTPMTMQMPQQQECIPNPAFQMMAQMQMQQMMQNAEQQVAQSPVVNQVVPDAVKEEVPVEKNDHESGAEQSTEKPVLTAKDIATGKKASKKPVKAVKVAKE